MRRTTTLGLASLLLVGALLIFASSSPLAPFLYPLF